MSPSTPFSYNRVRPIVKKLSVLVLILFSSFNIASQTFNDPDDLANAVNAAAGGGTFIVENGTYNNFESTFQIVATEANPIIIKAETIGGVTLTGTSHFVFKKSAYITLEGFIIDGTGDDTLVKLEGCNNIRITRNVFELSTTESIKWVFIGGVWNDNTLPFQYPSHHNRIDHNIFQNKNTPGHYITVDGTTDTNDVAYQSQYDRIDHNHFKNNSPRAVNEQESIRIGWSRMSKSSGYTTVEFNLFEDCDGDPEIVSVKSSDNIIRHNTFLKSYGTLSLRHGNRNRVEGNYFFGGGKAIGTSPAGSTLYTGGVRIYGTDHVIINNYMEGLTGTRWDAPITLTLGDAIDGSSSNLTKHFRAERVTIAYNTLVDNSHGIEIGFDNNGKYNTDLESITIANNLIKGSENSLVEIKDSNDQGSNITWSNNLMYPTGSATTIIGATSTTFDSSEVINENPNLTYNATDKVWKITGTSPIYNNVAISETINEDIEGQTRPATSNPGADHYSLESSRYKPLTTLDVGPNAYEVDDNTESLFLSSISNFIAAGESKDVTITANVDWTVTDDSDWITVTPLTGSNNGTISITASENTNMSTRSGTVTVSGGSLTRTLNITQEASDPRDGLNLINDGSASDNVSINYVFHEEVTATKNNVAINCLDKNFGTQWSGKNVGGVPGEIIFDLGGSFDLRLVDYATTNGKTYEFQIWVSSTGTQASDFTNAFPSGNLVSNTGSSFKSFLLPNVAINTRYIKIIGYGQPARPSDWNTITEIEFYGVEILNSLSNKSNDLANKIMMYPIPAKDFLTLKNVKNSVSSIQIFSLDGRKVMEKSVESSESKIILDVSSFTNGAYIVNLSNGIHSQQSKMIIISH